MAAHVPRKSSAMETLLEPSLKDVKKEKKMYGSYTKRRKEGCEIRGLSV